MIRTYVGHLLGPRCYIGGCPVKIGGVGEFLDTCALRKPPIPLAGLVLLKAYVEGGEKKKWWRFWPWLNARPGHLTRFTY